VIIRRRRATQQGPVSGLLKHPNRRLSILVGACIATGVALGCLPDLLDVFGPQPEPGTWVWIPWWAWLRAPGALVFDLSIPHTRGLGKVVTIITYCALAILVFGRAKVLSHAARQSISERSSAIEHVGPERRNGKEEDRQCLRA
jgi:hypothetical protein